MINYTVFTVFVKLQFCYRICFTLKQMLDCFNMKMLHFSKYFKIDFIPWFLFDTNFVVLLFSKVNRICPILTVFFSISQNFPSYIINQID